MDMSYGHITHHDLNSSPVFKSSWCSCRTCLLCSSTACCSKAMWLHVSSHVSCHNTLSSSMWMYWRSHESLLPMDGKEVVTHIRPSLRYTQELCLCIVCLCVCVDSSLDWTMQSTATHSWVHSISHNVSERVWSQSAWLSLLISVSRVQGLDCSLPLPALPPRTQTAQPCVVHQDSKGTVGDGGQKNQVEGGDHQAESLCVELERHSGPLGGGSFLIHMRNCWAWKTQQHCSSWHTQIVAPGTYYHTPFKGT